MLSNDLKYLYRLAYSLSKTIAWIDDDDVCSSLVAHRRLPLIQAWSTRWKPTPVPDEDAFEAIKAGLDSLPSGAKMLINSGQCIYYAFEWFSWLSVNSGEFYGVKPVTANLELVSRFFEKYPTYADKAFLSVKV